MATSSDRADTTHVEDIRDLQSVSQAQISSIDPVSDVSTTIQTSETSSKTADTTINATTNPDSAATQQIDTTQMSTNATEAADILNLAELSATDTQNELRRLQKIQQLQIQKAIAMANNSNIHPDLQNDKHQLQPSNEQNEANYFFQKDVIDKQKGEKQFNDSTDWPANMQNIQALQNLQVQNIQNLQNIQHLQHVQTMQNIQNVTNPDNVKLSHPSSKIPDQPDSFQTNPVTIPKTLIFDSNTHPLSRSNVTKLFICNHPGCNKTFSRKLNYMSHYQSAHEHKKPFKCDICQKTFARHSDRRRHEKSQHSQNKFFVCEGSLDNGVKWGCGKKFKRKDGLSAHWKSLKAKKKCFENLTDDSITLIDQNISAIDNPVMNNTDLRGLPSAVVDPLIKDE